MLDKAKEFIINEKKNIIIAIVLVVTAVIAYDLYGSNDNGPRVDEVRTNLQSVGAEQSRAREQITENKRIVTEVRETNQSIAREIDDSRTINKSCADLIAEGKSILRQVRSRNE